MTETPPKPRSSDTAKSQNTPEILENDDLETSYTQITYSGPLPPSHELAAYEKISPGAGKKIIQMAVEANRANIHITKMAASNEKHNVRLTGFIAFCYLFVFCAISIIALIFDKNIEAIITVGFLALSKIIADFRR